MELLVICRHGEGGESSFTNQVDYEDFIADHPAAYDWPDIPETAPMGLCYTSGTTGNPKGVMYTNRSTYLHTLTESLTDSMGCQHSIPCLVSCRCFMPWAGACPLPHPCWAPSRSTPIDYDSGFLPQSDAAGTGHDLGGRTYDLAGVRATLTANPDKFDLSKLQRLTCGGSAPPVEMMRWYWETFGVEMIQGWGMTETNPLGTLSRKVSKAVPDRIIRRSAV